MNVTIPSIEDLVQQAEAAFKEEFHCLPDVKACAPGRVNIIGEHTDYNDGFVLPMCISLVTVVVGKAVESAGDQSRCRVKTLSSQVDPQERLVEFNAPQLTDKPPDLSGPAWSNYIKGVIAHFRGKCISFDAVVHSSVPAGGGLSSSAALEVGFHTFLEALHPSLTKVSLRDKALACQEAEHVYAKMPCGIMDQFVSVMGKKNNALLIDCKSLETKLVEIRNPTVVLLITNSNVDHHLGSSEYPVRRSQCELASQILGVKSLREATLQLLGEKKSDMSDIVYRRARHVITENTRVLDAVKAMQLSDNIKLGHLMKASHDSLRDDYNVSCSELDQLVELALSVPGVYGSRMTGGGFGGCTVTLVKHTVVEQVMIKIKENYPNPTFYISTAEDGAKVL